MKNIFCIILFFLLSICTTNAQNINITGKVVDIQGEPIVGASVRLKSNPSLGTSTDLNGQFSLSNVLKQGILVVSYVGYLTSEYSINSQNFLNITLKEDFQALDEVVVVGYGSQKKVNLTGAVSSIDIGKVAASRPITNLSAGLAGLAPGLYVRSQNNDPGSNATLMIRGQGTLNNSSPLIIIDGVEGDISRVSPQDIENISVLKDAASASIYGSRAANGVILITTKQGKSGKININYDGYYAAQRVAHLMPFVSNSVEWMELINEAAKNSKQAQIYSDANIQLWKDHANDDPILWPNSSWNDGAFRTANTMNHNISVSGGTERSSSFISFNYANNPGIIENTAYSRYSIRANNKLQITPWLNVGMNLNGILTNKDRGSSNLSDMFTNSILAIPTVTVKHPDGRLGGTQNIEDNQVARSALAYMRSISGSNTSHVFNGRFFASLNPIRGLFIDGSYNYSLYVNKLTTIPVPLELWNFQTNTQTVIDSKQNITVTNSESRYTRNFMDLTIAYEKTVFNKLYFKAMLGGSQEQYVSENFSASKQNLIDIALTQIDAATGDATASGSLSDWAMRSYFGRLNFSWDEKYLFEFNFRRDGSSRFIGNNRWGNFPSFSAAWRITEEPFMKSLHSQWIDNFKLRISYGSLGNNAVGNYDAIPVLSTTQYVFNNVPIVGFYQSAIANSNLTWESTKVTNVGVDWAFLKNKLSGSLDLYNKLTDNILISLPAPAVHGISSIPTQNAAKVRNRGLELSLSWRDKTNEFNYFIETNFTFNKNKVVKFKGNEYSLSGTRMIKEGLAINTDYVLKVDRIVQTQTDLDLVQQIIDNAPLDPSTNKKMNPFPFGTPQLGDFLYKDMNGDGLVNSDDRVNIGNGPNPQLMYSFSFGVNYKDFDASVSMDGIGKIKQYFYNTYYTTQLRQSRIINREVADGRWYEGRTTQASFPRTMLEGDSRNLQNSDFWLQDVSYLKIRNIQIGYSFPQKVISHMDLTKLRIYGGLENYFTFTNFKGMDPEVPGMSYPSMKQAVVGVNLSF
ncbi:TonB-dependent receptor [Parabacteroides sp. Marseille-P3160]|uniref:SusC/RagA family TonB-linked outer membrane protein n=1 Tax=Parabacteroides sp. Marseille-P3160 TaxID=1917887 RepID=UPI0009BA4132|nr:TonB-dependent receptor [Parabacteroides sp. Marseille-P3160]